jgi:uncharacterized membrane protein YccC
MARLEMYGERGVREAYWRYGEADKGFVAAFTAWRHVVQQNLKADRGEVPTSEAVPEEELVRRRKEVEAARDHADEEQEILVAAVARAVGRMPRYQRRVWRRLKEPKA